MSISDVQTRLRQSRKALRSLGIPEEAIGVLHKHPDAFDAVRAAVRGKERQAPRVSAGPRFRLRDGYAAERDGERMLVVLYAPEGEVMEAPYGEKRTVIWVAGEV